MPQNGGEPNDSGKVIGPDEWCLILIGLIGGDM